MRLNVRTNFSAIEMVSWHINLNSTSSKQKGGSTNVVGSLSASEEFCACEEVQLRPEEDIVLVFGQHAWKNGPLLQIGFITSCERTIGPFGLLLDIGDDDDYGSYDPVGLPFVSKAPPGKVLQGLHGQLGSYRDGEAVLGLKALWGSPGVHLSQVQCSLNQLKPSLQSSLDTLSALKGATLLALKYDLHSQVSSQSLKTCMSMSAATCDARTQHRTGSSGWSSTKLYSWRCDCLANTHTAVPLS